MTVEASLRARVEAWIADDPDATTQAELTELLAVAESDDNAGAELIDRFTGRLEFGTAGIRGAVAAGPNRINRAVVIRAAAGLASYLKANHVNGTVIIGYDARRKSDEFAHDTAAVLQGAGQQAVVLPRPLPTPVLAFAIGHLDCIAGVMVTASHNPPADNGYKVYLGDGSQIVPPADAEIAARIDVVTSVTDVPRADGWRVGGEDVVQAYVDSVAALPDPSTARDLTMVYTALHGVGSEIVGQVLRGAGFSAPIAVPEQAEPDAAFPTVSFPNPEEPGAMDLAISLAVEVGADLVVANDPDADRCAVAVPTSNGWRMLRGDELGALLGHHLLGSGTRGVFASTIVSSSLLGRMARDHGVDYAETLTGFKWIGRVPGLSYGYEEALGYCVAPDLVRDKDGISALLLVAELAAILKANGSSLLERLDEIASRYGVYATDQLSVRVKDLALIDAAMQRLRTAPPASLGGFVVEQADDLSLGSDVLPATEALRYRLAGGGRVVVRPSGTEPKIKCYLEVVVPVEAGGVDASRIAAAGRLDAIRTDLAAAAGLPAPA